MKKKLLSMRFMLTMLALLFCTSNLMANDNVLRFRYYPSNHTAGLIGNSYIGDVVIPETVIIKGEQYTVTSVESQAFDKCSRVTSITLPVSIKSFYASLSDCIFLDRININSIESFLDMNINSDVQFFQNGVTELYLNGKIVENVVFTNKAPHHTLAGYKKLKNVTFNNPESTQIWDSTLAGCTNIDTLRFLSPKLICGERTSMNCKDIYIYGDIITHNCPIFINADFFYFAGSSAELHSKSEINVKTCLIDNNSFWTSSSSVLYFNNKTTIVVSPKIKKAYYMDGYQEKSYIYSTDKVIFLNPSIKLPKGVNYNTSYYVI